jgi:hypothetical protein
MTALPDLVGKYPEHVQELANTVVQLDVILNEIHQIIEKQIEAVVQSDSEELSVLTEKHTELQLRYASSEKEFIKKLKYCAESADNKSDSVKLEHLKDAYPVLEDWVVGVRKFLNEKVQTLSKKQSQLVNLLEFAITRNKNLMHSIYDMYNHKNKVYSSKGNNGQIPSGVAINQEI